MQPTVFYRLVVEGINSDPGGLAKVKERAGMVYTQPRIANYLEDLACYGIVFSKALSDEIAHEVDAQVKEFYWQLKGCRNILITRVDFYSETEELLGSLSPMSRLGTALHHARIAAPKITLPLVA